MGSLRRFDIDRYASEYSLPVLFETGTFMGIGVDLALEAGFEKIYSVEIVDEYYHANVARFEEHDNVTILSGESAAALDNTVGKIDDNILFWLDAHFPGADGGLCSYNSCDDDVIRCPLESELEIIRNRRPDKEDVFLIDHLNLYEVGEYGSGNLPEHIDRPANTSLVFINRLFSDTHHIVRLYYDEGYILLLPISRMPKLYVQRTWSEVSRNATM